MLTGRDNMTVQTGIASLEHTSIAKELLSQIGYDDSFLVKDGVAMCYTPFHATPQSRLEKQPYVSSQGLIMMWDGRLDNREDLSSTLAIPLDSKVTDLSLVAAAVAHWNYDCFSHILGDWALSIWNPEEKSLTLARDYAGIRKLYYRFMSKHIIWTTRLATILGCGIQTVTISGDFIAGYLAGYPNASLTPYEEVQTVPPGSYVVFKAGACRRERFWSFSPKRNINYKSDVEYEEHFRNLFRQAVHRRLRSDSPILAELSGGIDSSSIVCMADDVLAKGHTDAPRVDTISILDTRDSTSDEREYVSMIEKARGRSGHHINAADYGEFFSLRCEHLIPTPGSYAVEGGVTAAIFDITKRGDYAVTLSGLGGDEFLGGIPNPLPQLADLISPFHLGELIRQLTAWSLTKKSPWFHLLSEAVAFRIPTAISSRFQRHPLQIPWIDPGFARKHKLGMRLSGPHGTYGFVKPSQQALARSFVLMRRQFGCSPVHSLRFGEKRYPYLDQDLIEFLLAIPATQLLRPGVRRSLMRRALVGLVPNDVLWRKSKGVVSRSILTTFRDLWPEIESIFAMPLSAQAGFLNRDALLRSLEAAKGGDAPQLIMLLKAIYLELWLRSLSTHELYTSSAKDGITVSSVTAA